MQEQAQQISEEEQIKINSLLRHAKALLVQIGENTVYYRNNEEKASRLENTNGTLWYVWLFGAAALYFILDDSILLTILSLFLLLATGNYVYLKQQFLQQKADRFSEKIDDLAFEWAKHIGDKQEIFVITEFLQAQETDNIFLKDFDGDRELFLEWWQEKQYDILRLHFSDDLVKRKIAYDEGIKDIQEADDDYQSSILIPD